MSFNRPVMRTWPRGPTTPRSPGAEVAVLVEGVGVEAGVDVAGDHLRPLEPELALLARAEQAPVGAHHPKIDAGSDAPLGLRHLLVGVVDTEDGGDGKLGQSPARQLPDPEGLLQLDSRAPAAWAPRRS